MATKQKHEALREDSTTGSSEPDLEEDRITAYNTSEDEDAGENGGDDNATLPTDTVATVASTAAAVAASDALPGADTALPESKTEGNDLEAGAAQDGSQQPKNGFQTYGSQDVLYHGSMYRIGQLLNMTTSAFLMYFCLTLNGIIFFIGALSNTRNLGRLWFRADYSEEFEYSFGWHKSHELEGDWTPVGYEDLDSYFETDLVGAGEFVGAMCILGVILLGLTAMVLACVMASLGVSGDVELPRSSGAKVWKSLSVLRKESKYSRVCSGFVLGLSAIFFLIYIVSLLVFHTEFEDVCGELIGLLDSAHRFYHDQDLDHYECDDGWAMYLQYVNIGIYMLSMALYYEIQKGKIAIEIAKQVRNLHENEREQQAIR